MTDKKHKLTKEELLEQEAALARQEEARRNETLTPFEIHVMPKRFQNAQVVLPTKPKGNGLKIVMFVMIGILIFGLLVFGAYKLYISLSESNQEIIKTSNQEIIESQNQEITETIPAPTPTPEPVIPTPAPTPTTSLASDVATPEPVQEPVVSSQQPVTTDNLQLTTSIDTDSDGLTDTEEGLYGTTIRVPDTDNDGFVDGQEVVNGYSPVAVNQTLTAIAAINTFLNPAQKYSILHPSLWLARSTDDSKALTVFTSVTGEFVTVEVLANTNNESLSTFLINNQPQINPSNLVAIKTRKGYDGYSNANKTLYFVNVPANEKVYKITYDTSSVTRVNFLTTFEMMINSLSAL